MVYTSTKADAEQLEFVSNLGRSFEFRKAVAPNTSQVSDPALEALQKSYQQHAQKKQSNT